MVELGPPIHCRPELCFYGKFESRNGSACGCTCQDGYLYDRVWFHSTSCTLPNHALLVYFILYSIASVFIMVPLSRSIYRLGRSQRALTQALGAFGMVTWNIHALLLYLDSGTELGAIIANLIWLVSTHIQGYLLWYSFVCPIYMMRYQPYDHVRRRLTITTIFCCLIYLGFSIAIAVLVNDKSRLETYNLLIAVMFSVFIYVIFTASCLGILHHLNELRQICASVLQQRVSGGAVAAEPAAGGGSGVDQSNTSALQTFISKSRKLSTAIRVFFLAFFIAGLPFPISFGIVRVLPYAWLFFLVMGIGPIALCVGYLILDRSNNDQSSRNGSSAVTNMSAMMGTSGHQLPPPVVLKVVPGHDDEDDAKM